MQWRNGHMKMDKLNSMKEGPASKQHRDLSPFLLAATVNRIAPLFPTDTFPPMWM